MPRHILRSDESEQHLHENGCPSMGGMGADNVIKCRLSGQPLVVVHRETMVDLYSNILLSSSRKLAPERRFSKQMNTYTKMPRIDLSEAKGGYFLRTGGTAITETILTVRGSYSGRYP